MNAFSRADVIVGSHGSALANAGFAPPGCLIVSIVPDQIGHGWIYGLAQQLGHRLVILVAPRENSDGNTAFFNPFRYRIGPEIVISTDARGDGAARRSTRLCMMKIRYSQPVIVGRELDYVRQALEQGHLSSNGAFTHRCETWLSTRLNGSRAHLTHSATAGLELSALLAGLDPGDEVVMPAFTFVSCANAVVLRGAMPVFVDIRPDTLNLNPSAVAQAITARTRAIVAVHYAGVPCDMDPVMALAAQHGLIVIEDAAQALLSSYCGKPAGTLGHFGVISFHDTKNVISGEGGAIIINDSRFAERAESVYQKGTDRSAFHRGEQPRYSWVDLGSSFAPSEIIAAILLAQLEHAEEITRRRRALWTRYHSAFADIDARGIARRPFYSG